MFYFESLENLPMNRKSYPFSGLTEAELDAIRRRAADERAKAVAALFAGLGHWIGVALKRLFSWAQAIQSRTRAPLPH